MDLEKRGGLADGFAGQNHQESVNPASPTSTEGLWITAILHSDLLRIVRVEISMAMSRSKSQSQHVAPLFYIRIIDLRTRKSWKCFNFARPKSRSLRAAGTSFCFNFTIEPTTKARQLTHLQQLHLHLCRTPHIYHRTPPRPSVSA